MPESEFSKILDALEKATNKHYTECLKNKEYFNTLAVKEKKSALELVVEMVIDKVSSDLGMKKQDVINLLIWNSFRIQ